MSVAVTVAVQAAVVAQLDAAVAVAVAVTVAVVLRVGREHGAATCRTCCWGACSGSRRHGPPCTAGTGQSTCMLTRTSEQDCLRTGNGQEVGHHARSGQLQRSMPCMPLTRRRGSKCIFVIRCVGGKHGKIYCTGFLFQESACCSPYLACRTPVLWAVLP